jgi:uronate dehydrogenase
LRLLDIAPQAPARPGEEVIGVDVGDREATARALAGCGAVVHLAGIPYEASLAEHLRGNVLMTDSLFEAALAAGVRRVVFASTNHVTGLRLVGERVAPDAPVRPDSYYAVGKVAGEALGRLYADKHGLEVVCLRIGAFKERPRDERDLALWLSERDCLQLVERALDAAGVGFLVVYGPSANSRSWYEPDGWDVLGYEPRDDAERFAGDVAASSSGSGRWQGGSFAER